MTEVKYERVSKQQSKAQSKNQMKKKMVILIAVFILMSVLLIQIYRRLKYLQSLNLENYANYMKIKQQQMQLSMQKTKKQLKEIQLRQKEMEIKDKDRDCSKAQVNPTQQQESQKEKKQTQKQNNDVGNDENKQDNENEDGNQENVPKEDNSMDEDEDVAVELDSKEKKEMFETFWDYVEDKLLPPQRYFSIDKVTHIKQLPFCIISQYRIWNQELQESLNSQIHTNFHVVVIGKGQESLLKNNVKYVDGFKVDEEDGFYYQFKNILTQHCEPKQIVFIIRNPLKNNQSLQKMNQHFQTIRIWLQYEKYQQQFQITAFIRELYYNVQLNDFNDTNYKFLNEKNFDCAIIGMLELGRRFVQQTDLNTLYAEGSQLNKQILGPSDNAQYVYRSTRQPYQPLYFLTFNSPIKEQQMISNYVHRYNNSRFEHNLIERQQILRFLDLVQLKNLPYNHSLFELDNMYYQQKYNLSSYEESMRMCVVVPSYNNIPNNRYKKILNTIYYQNYSNYHIVFIDDCSTDATFQQSKKYATEVLKLTDDQIRFQKNKAQKFATYNIRLAANNFCKGNQVFVLVDGDDELVSKNVLKLLNSVYQSKQQEYWVVYTNFYSTEYQVGTSKFVPQQYFVNERFYRHYPRHFFGMVRSFITKLFLRILEKDHRDLQHKFFEVLYDQALQAPLFELAGTHIKYVPQLCYLYNRYTQVNVEARKNLKKRKDYLYRLLRLRKPYKALDKL